MAPRQKRKQTQTQTQTNYNPTLRARKASSHKRTGMSTQAAPSPDHGYDDYSSEGSVDGAGPMAKDDAESRLERLLFDDDVGFHNALKGHETDPDNLNLGPRSESESVEAVQETNDDLTHVDDADLFFLDTGTAEISKESLVPGVTSLADDEQGSLECATSFAAWEDSDDGKLRVSLMGNDRSRKLRLAEAEDVVNGQEYTKRLRRQFERLHPAPDWATEAIDRCAKRRKTERSVGMGNASDTWTDGLGADSDEEGREGNGEEQMSSKPLALLLQNSSILTRGEETPHSKENPKLREEVLDIQRLKDISGTQPSSIDSLSFHPNYPLLLSAGPASTLFLHHVSTQSASPNPLLTSLHVRRTPVRTCAFSSPAGNRIFLSGRRRYFHIWDLDTGKVEKVNGTADRREEQKSMERFKMSPCGRWMGVVGSTKKGGGVITILDATSLQWVAQVRIDSRGGVADFAWWSDGEGVCVVGKNGEVSEWDGKEKRVIARWVDEGAVGTTVLSLGGKSAYPQLGGDRWVAIGSSSGIVNIYDRQPWSETAVQVGRRRDVADAENAQSGVPRHPKPTRVLDQLTTPTSHLVFSSDGQFLVMASRWKRDALRLVHLPSCTVYKNWPTPNTPFGRISAVAISPGSKTLAVANEQGRIRLWEIHG